MSLCYSLQCDDCKEVLWIGQKNYIYTGEKHINALSEFFHDHIDHKLKFVNDENVGDNYKEIEVPGD